MLTSFFLVWAIWHGLDDTTSVGSFGVTIWVLLPPSISTTLMRPRRPKQYCLQLAISTCRYMGSVRSRWLDIGQVLFLLVYGSRRSQGPKTRKKRMRPISSHLDRTNLVNKGFLIWLSENFSCRIQRVVPSRQDGSILPARVANDGARFGWSSPLAELAI